MASNFAVVSLITAGTKIYDTEYRCYQASSVCTNGDALR